MSKVFNSTNTAKTINDAISNIMGTTTTSQGATADGLIVKEDLQPVVECVNGFDYAVHIKTITGIPPLSFHSMGQTLIWSLDGNTDSGNSVGDKTDNIFNIATWDNATVTRGTMTIDGTRITITSTGNDCYTETYNRTSMNIPVESGETYTMSWNTDITAGTVYAFTGETVANTVARVVSSSTKKGTFTVPEAHTVVSIRVGISTEGITGFYENIKIEKNDDATPYAPYGYDVPITVNNTNTYHCYISDVLRKSNGETPVYDTMSSDGTIIRRVDTDGTALEEPITETYTAPNVNVSWGNNTVDVDTTVSPTSMTITYKDN